MNHCWEDKAEYIRENYGKTDAYYYAIEHNGTCMLEAGHEEPHDFIADENLVIDFNEVKG